jgi:2-polyprenyl-3-methyl-5-hydroxy-6-metoxy-1,4-benzoquinol methylase
MTAPAVLDPTPILQMLQANQTTAVLKAAIDVGIFQALSGEARTGEAVAAAIGCPAASTAVLLDALCVLGLAERRATTYALNPLSRAFLVPGAATYLGDAAAIFAAPLLWDAFGRLTEAVRAGGTVMEQHAETASHPFWETFARSSAPLAFPAAGALAELLGPELAGQPEVRVLDVAAGSGIYGHTLSRMPNARVTFVDWPNVLPETRAWAERLGVDGSRERYLPGSVFEADLGGPYDVVVASHLYHHFDRATCQTLTRRLAGVLAPGGRLCVHDFVASPTLDNPGATMFSVAMLVWTRGGKAYEPSDYERWMLEAGLSRPLAHPLPGMPTTWLVARHG